MFKPGKPVHPSNGTGAAPDAATSPEGIEVSFDQGPNRGRNSTAQVIVSNLEIAGGNPLEVSFANGANGKFFSIPPQQTVTLLVNTHRCRLRGASGATSNYSILGIIS
jgi:hypothetical protein